MIKQKIMIRALTLFASLALIVGSAYATTCTVAGGYGLTYYCSIRCVCNNGVVQFASSDCTALKHCCRWTLKLGPGTACSVSTYCAPCIILST